jgi:hypothetical protein
MPEYKDANVKNFSKVGDLLLFLQENYDSKINYEKIRFEHLPEKISLVTESNNLKDIFAYYRKDDFIEKENIDLRKKR